MADTGIALRVTIDRTAMDMSVAIRDTNFIDIRGEKLVPGTTVAGVMEITSVSPECITAYFMGREVSLKFGETIKSKEIGMDNPYLSREDYSVTMEYADFSDFGHTLIIIDKVVNYHTRLLNIDRFSFPEKIVKKQDEARTNVAALCESDVSPYPLNALLTACDNRGTFEIVRIKQFKKILLQGIGKGCLLHNVDYAWTDNGARM